MKKMIFRGRGFVTGGIPSIMGILNVTPDSFSDGASSVPLEKRIETLISEGAAIIDVGGESTRPGAKEVPLDEELRRIIPAVKAIRKISPDVFISIDTRKAKAARAALDCGADIVNDVSGLIFDSGMAATAAEYSAGVIIMHMRALPENMQHTENLEYENGLLHSVCSDLEKCVRSATAAGVKKESIVLDPGMGFAKDAAQTMSLIKNTDALKAEGFPLLSAPSRKSFIGFATGEQVPANRDYGTCGAVIASAIHGYDIIRVHNVKAAADALKTFFAIERS